MSAMQMILEIEARGMRLADIAQVTGMSRSQVSRLASGKLSSIADSAKENKLARLHKQMLAKPLLLFKRRVICGNAVSAEIQQEIFDGLQGEFNAHHVCRAIVEKVDALQNPPLRTHVFAASKKWLAKLEKDWVIAQFGNYWKVIKNNKGDV